MKITIFNPETDKPRWILKMETQPNGKFKVHEDMKYPLTNPNDWEEGDTPGQALDNFLKVEQSLLDKL